MNNPKTDTYYLEKIVTDLEFVVEHMTGVDKTALAQNEILLDSMMFRLIQVQENAKKLTDEFKQSHRSIPWTDIAGLRNRIVHDYGNVDLSVIFDTLTVDVPWLVNELKR